MLYGEPLQRVVNVLDALGFSATTRHPKTAVTLVNKLRRERTTRLSQIQDIAGARIVIDGTRENQDEVVEELRSELEEIEDCECPPPIDRRETPSHGYRAVHLVPRISGFRVEIQVRTVLQDAWANLMEKWADLHGREIRYGGEPDDADKPFTDSIPDLTPRSLTKELLDLSESIAEFETAEVEVKKSALEKLAEQGVTITEIADDPERVDRAVAKGLAPRRETLDRVMELLETQLEILERMQTQG